MTEALDSKIYNSKSKAQPTSIDEEKDLYLPCRFQINQKTFLGWCFRHDPDELSLGRTCWNCPLIHFLPKEHFTNFFQSQIRHLEFLKAQYFVLRNHVQKVNPQAITLREQLTKKHILFFYDIHKSYKYFTKVFFAKPKKILFNGFDKSSEK